MYIMAGYPWYNVRARDELMALPGCTLAIDHKEDFELIMETFLNALSHLLNDGIKDRTIGEIDLPDIPYGQYGRYSNTGAPLPHANVVRNMARTCATLLRLYATERLTTCNSTRTGC